jgi:DMSO/TMAO reductase YedYZ heme-binding membrane subunit
MEAAQSVAASMQPKGGVPMVFLITLIVTSVLALLLRGPLHRFPAVFYCLAVLGAVATVWLFGLATTNEVLRFIKPLLLKGYIAFSILTLVMFIGVFPEGSWLSKQLMPVRGELSIIGSILIVGHFVPYMANYLGLATDFLKLKTHIALTLVVSALLLVLLFVLAVTSVRAIKRNMKTGNWKRVQNLAYVFFALVYVHILGYLAIPALNGAATAQASVMVYSAVYLVYVVLRVYNGIRSSKAQE